MGGDKLQVDHQGLEAMHQVSGKQAAHLASAQGYIRDNCSKSAAFRGVLTPFKATYDEVIGNANRGMGDAQSFSRKMSNALHHANQTYRDTDDGEKGRWTTTMQRAEGVSSQGAGKFAYKGMSKPLDDLLGIDPKHKDPLTSVQDKLKEKLGADSGAERQRKIDANAKRRNKDQVNDRAKAVRDDRSTGLSRKDRSAAPAAGRRTDNEDVRTRRGLLDNTVKPVKETVDTVMDDVERAKNVLKDAETIRTTVDDIGKYDDYESHGNSATTALEKELGR